MDVTAGTIGRVSVLKSAEQHGTPSAPEAKNPRIRELYSEGNRLDELALLTLVRTSQLGFRRWLLW